MPDNINTVKGLWATILEPSGRYKAFRVGPDDEARLKALGFIETPPAPVRLWLEDDGRVRVEWLGSWYEVAARARTKIESNPVK